MSARDLYELDVDVEASIYRHRLGRLLWVDALRGLAVLLMVVDHVLAAIGGDWVYWPRHTLTRLALPLFCVLAGWCWPRAAAGPRWKFLARIVPASIAGSVLMACAGLGFPDVLAPFIVVGLLSYPLVRWPGAVCALGVVTMATFPLSGWWATYHPGEHLALVAVGVLLRGSSLGPELREWMLRPALVLAPIGRRPLAWYLGHLAPLAVLGVLSAEPAAASALGPMSSHADETSSWLAEGQLVGAVSAGFVSVAITAGVVMWLYRMLKAAS